MHLRPLLLCAVVAAGIPLSAPAKVLWSGDFETGDLTQWSPKLDAQPNTTDRLVVVPSLRQGLYGMKVTVKPGDLDNGGNRAEVVLRDRMFHQGDEVWFHWYVLFPSDYQVTSKWSLFTQWHSGNPYGVPLGLNLHGTRLTMRVMGHQYDSASNWSGGVLWTEQLQKGKWMEFLLHVKWSDGNDGFVEMWKDGQLVVPKTYHPTLDADDYVYLKLGFYRDRTIDYAQTIYHDGMTIYDAKPLHLFETPADGGTGGTPDAGTGGTPDAGNPTDPDPVADGGTPEPTDGGTDSGPGDQTDGGTPTGPDSGPYVRPCELAGTCEAPPSGGCSSSVTGSRPGAMWTLLLMLGAAVLSTRLRRNP